MDDYKGSDGQCNCQECARLRAELEAIHDWLEGLLEQVSYNGMVKVAEKELDNRLTQLARVLA